MRKRGPEEEASVESMPGRARRLLDIGDRAKACKPVTVPGLAAPIGIKILSQRETREAHAKARAWCADNGFNPDAPEMTNSGIEFSNAAATQMLVLACVNTKGGFPLWDTEEELADDLTREQIRWLESKRQEFQRDVAPEIEDVSPAFFAEVIEAAKKGRKGQTLAEFFGRSPRSTLLAFAHFMDVQLPTLDGWTLPPTTTPGPQG